MRVLLQVPEGLKKKAVEIARDMESKGDEVIISCEPMWGACDIRPADAKALGCDKIIHIGHTKFMNSDFPVDYIEWRLDIDPTKTLQENYEKLKPYKRIGLLTSLQFLNSLDLAKKFLESKGHEVFVGEAAKTQRHLHAGQTLGCDVTSAQSIEKNVDAFLFLGSGKFHPLGLVLKSDKPLFGLNFDKDEIRLLDDKLFQKQKYAAIGAARHAKRFGILISVKPGQNMVAYALQIKKRLEKSGKEVVLISGDSISDDKLAGIEVDCWVNTACPRINVENRTEFNKPMIGIDEIDDVLKP